MSSVGLGRQITGGSGGEQSPEEGSAGERAEAQKVCRRRLAGRFVQPRERNETTECCCRLVVQLARTEEAGKRAILRYDPSARRGAAQQLLELDREVARLTAAKIKAQKVAAEKSRAAAELSRTCSNLKKRLAAVLHDQRRLIVQLGLSQQKAGHNTAARYPLMYHAGGATKVADAGELASKLAKPGTVKAGSVEQALDSQTLNCRLDRDCVSRSETTE